LTFIILFIGPRFLAGWTRNNFLDSIPEKIEKIRYTESNG